MVFCKLFIEIFFYHAFVSLFCISESETLSAHPFERYRVFIEGKASISTVATLEPASISSVCSFRIFEFNISSEWVHDFRDFFFCSFSEFFYGSFPTLAQWKLSEIIWTYWFSHGVIGLLLNCWFSPIKAFFALIFMPQNGDLRVLRVWSHTRYIRFCFSSSLLRVAI